MLGIELVKVLWIIVSLVGLLAALQGLRLALGDRKVLRMSGTNGARKLVADQHLRTESLRVVSQLLFLATALTSVANVQAPPNFLRTLTQLALLGVMVTITVNSILDLRSRRRLLVALEERDAQSERST